MKWAGDMGRLKHRRNAYNVLVGKPEGKGPFGSPGLIM
jgi:hypothetical protein